MPPRSDWRLCARSLAASSRVPIDVRPEGGTRCVSSGTPGSVRGARSNPRPYRDRRRHATKRMRSRAGQAPECRQSSGAKHQRRKNPPSLRPTGLSAADAKALLLGHATLDEFPAREPPELLVLRLLRAFSGLLLQGGLVGGGYLRSLSRRGHECSTANKYRGDNAGE